LFAVFFYGWYRLYFNPADAQILLAGTLLGYTMYELLHYYLHFGKPPKKSIFHYMKKYHSFYHFSYPEIGFGEMKVLRKLPRCAVVSVD